MVPLTYLLIITGCIISITLLICVSQIQVLKHALKAQALECVKWQKNYDDMRSVVYRTEHVVQGLVKTTSHHVSEIKTLVDSCMRIDVGISKTFAQMEGAKFARQQDYKELKALEQYTHSKLNKIFDGLHEVVDAGRVRMNLFVTIKDTP